MSKQHFSFTGLLLLTLTICTAFMKTNSNFVYPHSENIKKINKRPFQIQPIDITTIDRKVRQIHCYHDPHFSIFQTGDRLPHPAALTSLEHCLALVSWHVTNTSCIMCHVLCIMYRVSCAGKGGQGGRRGQTEAAGPGARAGGWAGAPRGGPGPGHLQQSG